MAAREVYPLKTWIYLRGFTYRDLARQSGVARSVLDRARAGGDVQARTAWRVCRALRVYPEHVEEFRRSAGIEERPRSRR